MRRGLKLFLIAALAVASPTAVEAAACSRVEPLAVLDVIRDAGGRPLIPVTLAGRDTHLLVDTEAYVAMLHQPAVRELGLRPFQPGGSVVTPDGASSREMVLVDDFRLGSFSLRRFDFWVDPVPGGNRTIDEMAGHVGGAFLYDFNAEFDFGANRLTLFPQSHCPGAGRPLEQFTVVPFRFTDSFDVTFPVMLDGKPLTAVLDTGASETTLNLSVALREFSQNPDAPVARRVYRRRFENLSVEGLTLDRPASMLVTGLSARAGETPDVIVGMSTLSRLHIYIAYVEHELYIAPAAAPAAGGTASPR
jgi:predicted aspartyl protease